MKNLQIREATTHDCRALAEIQVDSYWRTYASLLPRTYLQHFSFQEQEQDWEKLLAAQTNETLLVAASGAEVLVLCGRSLCLVMTTAQSTLTVGL